MTTLVILIVATALAQQSAQTGKSLDYAFFRDRVQPIFLNQRPGHARCIVCHDHGSPPLQPLSPGAVAWNEEQSRKNFDIWKLFVTPGNPKASKLLQHPLAEQAGGDHFHAGGKHWKSQTDPEWRTLAKWVAGAREPATPPLKARVLQTNAAGDDVDVIDPVTNEIVGVIKGIEVPHGVALAPDGSHIYVTNESLVTLDVVDPHSLRVVKRIPLSGHPNNLDVSKDGTKVYVGIRQGSGAVDVIDTRSMTNVKTVPVTGAIHNVYVTPDGRFAVAGSIAASTISVIDTGTNTVAWTLKMSSGIRPMAFTKNADGSTREIIVQLSDFHGFAVVDFATHKEIKRVVLPDPPGKEKETQGIQGSPSHGLAITPDGKTLWATSKYYGYAAAYSLPDFVLQDVVPVGSHPEWLTIPPDGKNLYVAIAGKDTTVVIDNKTRKVIATIAVGFVPKRNTSGMMQTN